MNNFSDFLSNFLFYCGIKKHSTLIVHSAFRQLSIDDIKAEDVCRDLINYLPHGTLIMPTMTWRTVTSDNPNFYKNTTPSHTGILTEIFRKEYSSHRSLHPSHSVAAYGKYANCITNKHHISSTPCSINSPYGIIENSELLDNCYILFINTAIESCTYIHYFEETYAPYNYLEKEKHCFYLHNNRSEKIEYHLHKHNKKTRNFHQYGKQLRDVNSLWLESYNRNVFLIAKVKSLSNIMHSSFKNNKDSTLAINYYFQ